jgi:hypothetical protein
MFASGIFDNSTGLLREVLTIQLLQQWLPPVGVMGACHPQGRLKT